MAAKDSFDLDAAGLRADGGDVAVSVEALAAKLEGALPSATRVVRRSRRLLSKDKRVEQIEVTLAGAVYGLRSREAVVDAWRERRVGGISIKREQLDLRGWLEALTADLREEAGRSADARAALERLLG